MKNAFGCLAICSLPICGIVFLTGIICGEGVLIASAILFASSLFGAWIFSKPSEEKYHNERFKITHLDMVSTKHGGAIYKMSIANNKHSECLDIDGAFYAKVKEGDWVLMRVRDDSVLPSQKYTFIAICEKGEE